MPDEKKPNLLTYWQPHLHLVAKLSSWIVGPVLMGVFLGKWLDKQFDTEPWLFVASVGVSFIISMAGLVINTLKEYKNITNSNPPTDKDE